MLGFLSAAGSGFGITHSDHPRVIGPQWLISLGERQRILQPMGVGSC